jgi:hypothetical protein
MLPEPEGRESNPALPFGFEMAIRPFYAIWSFINSERAYKSKNGANRWLSWHG